MRKLRDVSVISSSKVACHGVAQTQEVQNPNITIVFTDDDGNHFGSSGSSHSIENLIILEEVVIRPGRPQALQRSDWPARFDECIPDPGVRSRSSYPGRYRATPYIWRQKNARGGMTSLLKARSSNPSRRGRRPNRSTNPAMGDRRRNDEQVTVVDLCFHRGTSGRPWRLAAIAKFAPAFRRESDDEDDRTP